MGSPYLIYRVSHNPGHICSHQFNFYSGWAMNVSSYWWKKDTSFDFIYFIWYKDALDAAQKGRTTITIAHRLSTIVNVDKIYVIGTWIEITIYYILLSLLVHVGSLQVHKYKIFKTQISFARVSYGASQKWRHLLKSFHFTIIECSVSTNIGLELRSCLPGRFLFFGLWSKKKRGEGRLRRGEENMAQT